MGLNPQTTAGRAFATLFMLFGVGLVLYALTTAVQSIVQSELLATFGQRRRSRKMSRLRNHFIISRRWPGRIAPCQKSAWFTRYFHRH